MTTLVIVCVRSVYFLERNILIWYKKNSLLNQDYSERKTIIFILKNKNKKK